MDQRAKRVLSYVLRFGVAAAGVLFIVLTLNWQDQVVVPPAMLPMAAEEPLSLPLVAMDARVATVRLPDGSTLELDRSSVGLGENDRLARLKPGILNTLRGADWGLIAAGMALVGLILPMQAVRWHLLMRSQAIPATFPRTLRLTYVGMFFNICMPGMTGGDVARAYYAARGSAYRTRAVMSVFFDRVLGLLGLILLAALAGLLVLDEPLAAKVTVFSWALLIGTLLVGAVYFSERGRRWLGVEWLMRRAGRVRMLGNADAAAQAYRQSPGVLAAGLALSLPVHVILCVACAMAGYALGMERSLGVLVAVLPVVFLAGSLPISVQGLGVMEALTLGLLLSPPAATTNQLVGMLLIYRLFLIGWALIGSLAMLGGTIRLHPGSESERQETVLPST